MTDLTMKIYTLTNDFHPHECGGTILAGPDHSYCDRCGAFAYDAMPLPGGTDVAANKAAWDDGDDCSPTTTTTTTEG